MKKFRLLSLFLALCFLLSGCLLPAEPSESPASSPADPNYIVSPEAAPDYSGVPYVAIRGNVPDFTEGRNLPAGYEYYAPLDLLGRCGVTEALVGPETLPTEERGNIGQVKPSGWVMAKYDFVDGKYLYNRCHLIGYQLTGENANTSNLITGTRYMNVDGMLPFENMVADYVRETGNHVRYRVTPIFRGTELVARGVQMEAMSVEDGGDAVCFNVYVYTEGANPNLTQTSIITSVNEADLRTLSSESHGTYTKNGLRYSYIAGELLSITWTVDDVTIVISGNSALYDYPYVSSTLVGKLLNTQTAESAVASISENLVK